jgi:hypothetical protein
MIIVVSMNMVLISISHNVDLPYLNTKIPKLCSTVVNPQTFKCIAWMIYNVQNNMVIIIVVSLQGGLILINQTQKNNR